MLIHENHFTTGPAMAYRGLLDLRQLKGNAICDLENNEIQEIVDIQDILRNDDFMNEATDKITNWINASEQQGMSQHHQGNLQDESQLSNENNQSLDELEKYASAKSTQQQMERHSRTSKTFLKEHNLNTDISNLSKETLASYLRYFYSTLKCKNGELYSTASLIGIRAALMPFSYTTSK